ncbi:MAG: polysaccharide biosynthesis tyrosine autokinase [Pseudomonadota bacterium]
MTEYRSTRQDIVLSSTMDDAANFIDIAAVWRAVRRRWLLILAVFLTCGALAALMFFATVPRYQAVSTVVIERQADEVIPGEERSRLLTDSPAVDTAVQVLKSPLLAGRVVDALDLTTLPEFNPGLVEPDVPQLPQAAIRSRAIRILLSAIEVKRVGVSFAINVLAQSTSPQLAADIADEIIAQYANTQLARRSGDTGRNAELLAARLEQLRQQVLKAESAVATYRSEENLFDADSTSSVTQQELSVLNSQLADAKAYEAATSARYNNAQEQLERDGTLEGNSTALSSPNMARLKATRATLRSTLAELTNRYGPRYPQVESTFNELADIENQIAAEAQTIVSGLRAEAQIAANRTAFVAKERQTLRDKLAADTGAAVRLSELERNAESARTLYRKFLDSYQQAIARKGTESKGVAEVLLAQVPVIPFEPNRMMFAAIALASALGLAGLLVLFLQYLEQGLETSESIESKLRQRALGSIPELVTLPGVSRWTRGVKNPSKYLLDYPKSAFAEAFRGLQTSLFFKPGERPQGVVAITSSLPNEGKTTTAVCLARSCASSGIRTVLVDCDPRRRASSRWLRQDARSAGLSDYLEGTARLEHVIIKDEISGAYFVPENEDKETPTRLLQSQRMEDFIETLRSMFDVVIMDTTPVIPVAEARVIATMADKVLFLVKWRLTPAKAAQLALRYLTDMNANIAGVALSRVDMAQQARHGYGDAGRYFKQYKAYYK